MSLLEKIEQDFQVALKQKNQAVTSTLRLLKAALTNKEKEGKKLTEEIALAVLKSQIKQRKDSITEYQKAERNDLAAKEEEELKILEDYLPEQLSEERIKEIIDKVVTQLAEEEQNNFGKVMGAVMKEIAGQAEGSLVTKLVKDKLSAAE